MLDRSVSLGVWGVSVGVGVGGVSVGVGGGGVGAGGIGWQRGRRWSMRLRFEAEVVC